MTKYHSVGRSRTLFMRPTPTQQLGICRIGQSATPRLRPLPTGREIQRLMRKWTWQKRGVTRSELLTPSKPTPLSGVEKAWPRWLSELKDAGCTLYLVTFLFEELLGNQKSRNIDMCERITKFYYDMLPRIVRHHNRVVNLRRRPMLIAVPEGRWRKALNKFNIADVRPNDGEHFHAIFIVPSSARPETMPFQDFFARNSHKFIASDDTLRTVHILPMDDRHARVWGYIYKSKTGNLDAQADILILPRAKGEKQTESAPRRTGGIENWKVSPTMAYRRIGRGR